MAQWAVYQNPSARVRDELPYLVVIQSDLLASLATRLVIPLARSMAGPDSLPRRLVPSFRIRGEMVILLPQEAGIIAAKALGKPVASLRDEAHLLIDALDAVISGI
ncbi:MAG: CcdB family protein [Burkholderiales bacterium]|nr:CcdB family protein [Burkholderiales bacterium]MDE2455111.1 CcdB family protein [Burkholderiales bacterium]